MRAYLRVPTMEAEFLPAQSQDTAILVGWRWLHLKNLKYGIWLAPSKLEWWTFRREIKNLLSTAKRKEKDDPSLAEALRRQAEVVRSNWRKPPERPGTSIERISLRKWLELVGPRGYLEIAEDLVGVRACQVARWLLWLPFWVTEIGEGKRKRTKLRRALTSFLWPIVWLATMDQRQNCEQFDRDCEKPRVQFGMGAVK